MPGGLIQLVGVGAQNELVNGNPSMTHFRAVYRRHTNFAMESIRMSFTSSNLEFATNQTRTLSCRVDRFAQLLHDTYLVLTLPDIWSPLKEVGTPLPPGYDQLDGADSIGYEFQWIENIGYNMIDHVDITLNGQVIQRLRGEWLKMYSYLTHDRNKRSIVDQMVGNVVQLTDPGNAYDRVNQYPHAVAGVTTPTTGPLTKIPEPSIRSRQLVVPLHFWFCENPGQVLPLVALQNSEVYINVTLRALNDLYTVIDVNRANPTFGTRIKPTGDAYTKIGLFLSPPNTDGTPSNPGLNTFYPDPYLEGNFIYLTEMELNQIARADTTTLVKTVSYTASEGQFGANTDLKIPLFNLVTRIIFASQRSDRILVNDWDNYTNWENRNVAPYDAMNTTAETNLYTSGQQQVSSVFPRDTISDAVLLLDGKERFQTKPTSYFSLLQMYRHVTGIPPELPGVYMYSFALDHDQYQPSGALNGSAFNEAVLRLNMQQPLPEAMASSNSSVVCVLRSSLFSPNPVVIPDAQRSLYNPGDIVSVVQTNDNVIFTYTYNVGVYVESLNFFRIVSGLGNLVFAS